MIRLDGKLVSEKIKLDLKFKVENFVKNQGRAPCLAVVLVGEDPASVVYVRNKEKACHSVGIDSKKINLNSDCSQNQLISKIQELNNNPLVDGILVQLPLPSHLNKDEVLQILSPSKDADGLTYASLGLLWGGKGTVVPCTPKGVMTLLRYFQIPIEGKNAVVVGRSNIVGKPMAYLLSEANATVTICHSKTVDLKKITQAADIVILAAGKKSYFGKNDFKKGAVIVDVGIHGSGQGGGVCGDVRFKELEDWAYAATPVPGGVGPMTIASLLENTLQLAEANIKGTH